MTTRCDKALGFWTIGIQYLHLVQAVSNETYNQGNKHSVTSNRPISPEQYAEETKWSDHNLVIPLLFNFYHGIEVILKGFLSVKKASTQSSHKITKLYEAYIKEYGENDLGNLIKKYIFPAQMPEILVDFLNESGISIDDYYQSLKYPESTKRVQFLHHPLKYKGDKGKPFFLALYKDIETLRKEVVSLGNQVCNNEKYEFAR